MREGVFADRVVGYMVQLSITTSYCIGGKLCVGMLIMIRHTSVSRALPVQALSWAMMSRF